jgi:hypothetical protein
MDLLLNNLGKDLFRYRRSRLILSFSCAVVVASADDFGEGILEGGTSDEEAVDVWLLNKFVSILVGDTSTVEDAGLVCGFGGDV